MSRFFGGLVSTTFFVVIGVMGATAPAVASQQCMTQEEARKAFPHDHIYWHGLEHCWDNNGRKRNTTPVADAGASYAAATQPDTEPAAASVNEPAEPAVDRPATPVVVPPVPFIGGAMRQKLSWPVLDAPANDLPARLQVADALQPALPQRQENVSFGAPDAAPGSPEYLLENCCWPKPESFVKAQNQPLRHIVLAIGGSSGLAIGFWLFVVRRQSERRRIAAGFGNRAIGVAAVSLPPPRPGPRYRRAV